MYSTYRKLWGRISFDGGCVGKGSEPSSHMLVKRWESTITANTNLAIAA